VPEVLTLVDHLRDQKAYGHLRFGADLMALAGEVQRQIVDTIMVMAERAAGDRSYHDAVMSFSGMWGRPTLFLAVAHKEYGIERAGKRLALYLKAKRYQLRSDRSFGLLFDERIGLQQFIFDNEIPDDDAEMDALVHAMGLQSSEQ
jgi:hypothetical protein